MEEHRRAARNRVLKSGRLVFNEKRSTVDCTVRNQSATGALLLVASPLGLPDEVELYIPRDDFHRACRIIRREGDRVAVEFLDRRSGNSPY
jgi:hypothetical protein